MPSPGGPGSTPGWKTIFHMPQLRSKILSAATKTHHSQIKKKDVRYKHTPIHIYMCVYAQSLSHVQLFETSWTVAFQTPLSRGFSRQEYWSGLPFPPGNLPYPGIKPMSPASPVLAGGFFTTEPPGKPIYTYIHTHTMMEYCSIIKNENSPFATTWVDLEGIMLSVRSQRKTNTLYVITYMWNLKN